GEYVITGEDVLHGRKFDDVVVRGYFPVDIHNLKGKEGYQGGGVWADPEDSYDIPMRTLIPRVIDGLVMAGRAISATHEAHGSLRTQGGAMGIGHAAGALAARAAKYGGVPRKVPYAEVEELLLSQKASLHRDPSEVARLQALAAASNEEALESGKITGLYFPGALAGAAPRL
ncbi:MAG: hypothetical protein JWN09_2227, partial [Microbacteriaceae bacterium]|nr:hypothetical protein [Microbacteriaceae bacterium]